MPAPVPPGYTRGPLLLIDTRGDDLVDRSLYQWFSREAGGYGARILLLAVEPEQHALLDDLAELCAAWEAEQVKQLRIADRAMAGDATYTAAAEYATAIAILGEDSARLAATLGGTPLATAIRRANARSKVVAGIGGASGFLCQHVLRPGPATAATLRDAVVFWPGLGLLNRVTLDALGMADEPPTRLRAAVAANPFLVGVGLAPGSAVVIHQDNTVQSLGRAAVTVVDGSGVTAIDLDAPSASAQAVTGAAVYPLALGDGFNLDDRVFRPAGDIDLPPTGPVTSVL